MRPVLMALGTVLAALLLVACGGDSDEDPGDTGGDAGDAAGANDASGGGEPTQSPDPGELSYLTLAPRGVLRVDVDSGEQQELIEFADLGLATGEPTQVARLVGDLLWLAVGPGHLVAIDPTSGGVERGVEFGSTQPITDFGFLGGLIWVQAGFAFSDAVVLGVDRVSGDLVFNVEPPAGTSIGGMAVGDEGVWVIGGDPETVSSVSRIDSGAGNVTGTFNAGLVAQQIAVGAGGVWVGGNQFASDGADGDAIAHLDPVTGEVIATIPIGETLGAIIEYDGAIWVSDASGPEFSGAQLHRIDPETNEITDTVEVGEGSAGSLNLVAGGGYILAINTADRQTYVVNAATAEGESVIIGPTPPIAIP